MSLQTAALLVGTASYAAPTGGTSKTFAPTGKQLSGGVELACYADAITTRDTIIAKALQPKLMADGSYTMARPSIKAYCPRIVTIGSASVLKIETVLVEITYYPDADADRRQNLRNYAAAFVLDADTIGVFDNLSLA